MRLCIERNEEHTFWKAEMGNYEVLAICDEIRHAMLHVRAGDPMDRREETSVVATKEQKLCVEYNQETQHFSWTRNGLSPLDAEIMCLIVIGEIYLSWQK